MLYLSVSFRKQVYTILIEEMTEPILIDGINLIDENDHSFL